MCIYCGINIQQANSKNCGPLPSNKFDLEIGQMTRSVTIIMHTKYQCYITNTLQDMSQVKYFCDRQTEGQTNEF